MPDTHLSRPARIVPDAIYHDGDARLLLGLTSPTMARARREGHLRYTRQGHAILYRGQWLLDWLESTAAQIDTHETTDGEVSHG